MDKQKREGTGGSHYSFAGKKRLESIFLFTTGKCNAKCSHCFYVDDSTQKTNDLSFEEIKKISQSAGEIKRLWLSGGEPTLRQEVPEIVEMFYNDNHITDVNIPSNGIKGDLLVSWLHRLTKSCPTLNFAVSISVDGFNESHNKQRGVDIFYNAIETLVKLEKEFADNAHVVCNIASIITKHNYTEMSDFLYWVYGRFNVCTHTAGAARGETREDGVKISTEKSIREFNDEIAPYLMLYAQRMGEGTKAKGLTTFIFAGLMRAMYNIEAANIEKPSCWGVNCTAGETTLVIDHDGAFRSCEMRPPVGRVQDYDCDIKKLMKSDAMKNEIKAIGHGYTANCWCSHACWLMASIVFSPLKMFKIVSKGFSEVKRLAKKNPVTVDEAGLTAIEAKYNLDIAKLKEIGVLR
jgi:MoaA/NifB/PqqE/SkfB family radical SAM enzyme